ncbi:hypothetical protein BOW53_06970 [Solemya pervernicosa gill symbiont]|uniref:N-acetyltransferase domain-containing protein n=1 Tax=Solemya pervernicosa gill symbiont TaxID=642797 RepID=A0A1T2L649_9GAMM|nr:hypothetical protein BOW53_06970 [Solemya pervernicosa gill symbiont]
MRVEVEDFELIKSLYYSSDLYHYEQMPNEFRMPGDISEHCTLEGFNALYSSSDYVMLMARVDGDVCGIVSGSLIDQKSLIHKSRLVGYIDELSVAKPFRRIGVAQMLVAEIECYFQKLGAEEMVLSVYEFNDSALDLYAKLGYQSKLKKLSKSLS